MLACAVVRRCQQHVHSHVQACMLSLASPSLLWHRFTILCKESVNLQVCVCGVVCRSICCGYEGCAEKYYCRSAGGPLPPPPPLPPLGAPRPPLPPPPSRPPLPPPPSRPPLPPPPSRPPRPGPRPRPLLPTLGRFSAAVEGGWRMGLWKECLQCNQQAPDGTTRDTSGQGTTEGCSWRSSRP